MTSSIRIHLPPCIFAQLFPIAYMHIVQQENQEKKRFFVALSGRSARREKKTVEK